MLDLLQILSREEKITLLHRVDKVARNTDPRVQEVSANITGIYEQVLVAATDNILAEDVRSLVCLFHQYTIVEQDGKHECGSSGGGAFLL